MTKKRRFRRRRNPWWPDELTLSSAGRALAIRLESLGEASQGPLPAALSISKEAARRLAPSRELRAGDYLRRFVSLLIGIIIAINIFWVGTTSLLVFSYKFVEPSATLLMAWRAWADGWKIQPPRPVPLKSVPFWLRSMLISVEDHKFYSHHGFDFEAIKQAYEIDKRLGQPLYGGSTLTMQVARTLFLVPVKSYVRKYLEVIATIELEALLGKDRILQFYFGYAEWGKGIFGIDAAARRWFGKGVRVLTREEGARLVAILSSPIKYRPDWFGRSLILQERYDFLVRRYLPSLEPEPSTATSSTDLVPAPAGDAASAPVGDTPTTPAGDTTPAPAGAAAPPSLPQPAPPVAPMP